MNYSLHSLGGGRLGVLRREPRRAGRPRREGAAADGASRRPPRGRGGDERVGRVRFAGPVVDGWG